MPMARTPWRAISRRPTFFDLAANARGALAGVDLQAIEAFQRRAVAAADAKLQFRATDFNAEEHGGGSGAGVWGRGRGQSLRGGGGIGLQVPRPEEPKDAAEENEHRDRDESHAEAVEAIGHGTDQRRRNGVAEGM